MKDAPDAKKEATGASSGKEEAKDELDIGVRQHVDIGVDIGVRQQGPFTLFKPPQYTEEPAVQPTEVRCAVITRFYGMRSITHVCVVRPFLFSQVYRIMALLGDGERLKVSALKVMCYHLTCLIILYCGVEILVVILSVSTMSFLLIVAPRCHRHVCASAVSPRKATSKRCYVVMPKRRV